MVLYCKYFIRCYIYITLTKYYIVLGILWYNQYSDYSDSGVSAGGRELSENTVREVQFPQKSSIFHVQALNPFVDWKFNTTCNRWLQSLCITYRGSISYSIDNI